MNMCSRINFSFTRTSFIYHIIQPVNIFDYIRDARYINLFKNVIKRDYERCALVKRLTSFEALFNNSLPNAKANMPKAIFVPILKKIPITYSLKIESTILSINSDT